MEGAHPLRDFSGFCFWPTGCSLVEELASLCPVNRPAPRRHPALPAAPGALFQPALRSCGGHLGFPDLGSRELSLTRACPCLLSPCSSAWAVGWLLKGLLSLPCFSLLGSGATAAPRPPHASWPLRAAPPPSPGCSSPHP